jgi:hypothetical protein
VPTLFFEGEKFASMFTSPPPEKLIVTLTFIDNSDSRLMGILAFSPGSGAA